MTRNEVLNIPAGREMDKQIDRKIFGMVAIGELSPNYSTDIGDAWKVVDHMYSQTVQAVYVRFKNELKYLTPEQAMPSWIMSLAICSAALLAVRVSE